MSPKRDTSKKRQEILEAAIREFEAVGYDNTSMDRIAEAAGASKRTVYNHFPSKEALFRATLERLKEGVEGLQAIDYDPDRGLETQLGDFLDAKRSAASNPAWRGLAKVVIAVFIAHPELAREFIERMAKEEDHLVAWLRDATADGRLRVEDPKRAAQVFWATASGLFFWPSLFFGPVEEDEAASLKEEVIALFLARYGVDGSDQPRG